MATTLDNWTLEKWLKRIGMGKYKQSFIDNGYDTPDLCANVSKEDLDAVGVTNKHHRSTLFTQARKLLKLVDKDRYFASMNEGEDGEEVTESTPAVVVGNGKLPPGHDVSGRDGKNNRVTLENPPTGTASQPGLLDYSEPWSGNGTSIAPTASSGSVAAPVPAVVAAGTQPGLMDYSEPWSGNAVNPAASGVSGSTSTNPPAAAKPIKRVQSGSPADATDGPGPNTPKKPLSPGISSESSTPKKEGGSTGMTRLQFKLKIREELFHRNVVLSEAPYCTQDGTPDEGLMLELATELSDKFDMESLTMYDALKEVWANANKCSYNPAPMAAPKVKVELKRDSPKVEVKMSVITSSHLDNYDEPFDTTNATSPKPVTPSHQTPVHLVSTSSADNYDEPFDTTNPTPPQLDVPSTLATSAGKKSSTMPSSSAAGDLSNYDEPFDTLSSASKANSSPEKTKEKQLNKESSKTLPSPRRQRKAPDSSSDHSSSPRHSPARAGSSKSRFTLFKKKDKDKKDSRKVRALSMKEDGGDVQFIQNKDKESSSHGLIVSFGTKSKGTSSEDVSNLRISPSTEQLSFMQKGQTPPLPSPRPKVAHGSSGESDDSPQFSGPTKTKGGAVFRKFTTPPVSNSNLQSGITNKSRSNGSRAKSRFSQGSEDEDNSAWLTGSKSFEELNGVNEEVDPQRVVTREKKSRTSKLIKHIFKRKTMTPGSMKQSKLGGGSTMIMHRTSKTSVDDELVDREGALMASISMPDIATSRGDTKYKSSLKDLHNYSEIEDSPFLSKKNFKIDKNDTIEKENKKVPLKPPRKSPRPSPRPSPQHSPSPTLDRNSMVTSPPLCIPRTSHRQVVIRGVSESSTPDQTTIPIFQPSSVPSMGFGTSVGEDGTGGRGGRFSQEDHVRIVKASNMVSDAKEDPEATSSGLLDLRDLARTPSLTRSEQDQEDRDRSSKRLSSVSSNTSDTSSSGKPTKKPKPPGLAGKRPMKASTLSPAKGPVVAFPLGGKNEEATKNIKSDSSTSGPSAMPPPKPARTLPRTPRHSSTSSSSATTSPTRVSFEQDEDLAGKEVFSPTGEGDFNSQRSSMCSTPPTSPLSPLSPNTLQNPPYKAPPPKPSRKARSMKVAGDQTATKEDSGSTSSSQFVQHYPNATLPSKFKPVSSATPPSTPTTSSKPKPVPRIRRT